MFENNAAMGTRVRLDLLPDTPHHKRNLVNNRGGGVKIDHEY
jgi:hypothetical protein